MTPSEEKKPLPTSKNPAASSQLTNFSQWKVSLLEVKILYYKRQWRECINQCQQLTQDSKNYLHPVHASYLHTYCALSNELLARSMHNLSVSKLSLLLAAKESYETAAKSLPKPDPLPTLGFSRGSAHYTASELPSPASSSDCPSSPPTPTPRSRYQLSSPTSLSSTASISSSILRPSPLRIRKIDNKILTPSYSTRPLNFFPPKVSASLSSSPITFSTSTDNWLRFRAQERYNAHLESFAEMLQKHILTSQRLIAETEEIQAQWYTGKGLATYGNDKATKAADKRERIQRLKACGWKRERFEPGRYMELCAAALAEL